LTVSGMVVEPESGCIYLSSTIHRTFIEDFVVLFWLKHTGLLLLI